MEASLNLEESLRETACSGDLGKVEVLVRAGVNVNSQNKVNGWTALHWAARRNHKQVVSYLLQNGADANIRSFKNELAIDVTENEEIKCLLSDKESKIAEDIVSVSELLKPAEIAQKNSSSAGFVPNYLQNPEFPYAESVREFATRLGVENAVPGKKEDSLPNSGQGCPPSSGELSHSDKEPDKSILVLKCRIADSEETDFIEVELNPNCLTFESLLQACMSELDLDRTRLKKVRKLPNTIVRNDRDVKRLVQFQEIELVID